MMTTVLIGVNVCKFVPVIAAVYRFLLNVRDFESRLSRRESVEHGTHENFCASVLYYIINLHIKVPAADSQWRVATSQS